MSSPNQPNLERGSCAWLLQIWHSAIMPVRERYHRIVLALEPLYPIALLPSSRIRKGRSRWWVTIVWNYFRWCMPHYISLTQVFSNSWLNFISNHLSRSNYVSLALAFSPTSFYPLRTHSVLLDLNICHWLITFPFSHHSLNINPTCILNQSHHWFIALPTTHVRILYFFQVMYLYHTLILSLHHHAG